MALQVDKESDKELEARLERAEYRLGLIAERYALATSAADVGVWDWNLQTGEFYLDPNIKGFLGYQDEDIPNDIEVWANHIHPDDKDAVMKAAQDTINGRAAEYAFEHRMLHKDGSVRWFMVRGRAIRDHRGRAIRFVGTDVDITERRELERQVRELASELQTRIGHDLHDTLGPQLTALSLKLRNAERAIADKTSKAAEQVREARGIADYAIALSDSLSRTLSPVLGAEGLVESLTRLAEQARQLYGIECVADLPATVPERLSQVCGNELYRITQEAIANAVRHGKATRVDIEGLMYRDRFLLNIADNGMGIDLADSENVPIEIKIMKYRARHLGGSVTISARRDRGVLLVCSCPITG